MSPAATEPLMADELAAANRTRATGAGIDPNQYSWVTDRIKTVTDWTPTFTAVAGEHRRRGDEARSRSQLVSAGEAYLQASLWSHFATTWPNPDRAAHREAAAAAAADYRASLAQLDRSARWIDRRHGELPFAGVLRRPDGVANPPLVLIVAGLDSGKEEFHYVSEALLRRGLATFAFDGPGQAELSAHTVIDPGYQRVVTRVIDALDAEPLLGVDLRRLGAIALSLGGFYGIKAAAAEPRIGALVTVSGVCALPWETLPQMVADTLIQRCGSRAAARRFADGIDASAVAAAVRTPLLVVAGGQDPIPRPEEARRVANVAPQGQLLFAPEGDHLLANAQWQWLAQACDWLNEHLGSAHA